MKGFCFFFLVILYACTSSYNMKRPYEIQKDIQVIHRQYDGINCIVNKKYLSFVDSCYQANGNSLQEIDIVTDSTKKNRAIIYTPQDFPPKLPNENVSVKSKVCVNSEGYTVLVGLIDSTDNGIFNQYLKNHMLQTIYEKGKGSDCLSCGSMVYQIDKTTPSKNRSKARKHR